MKDHLKILKKWQAEMYVPETPHLRAMDSIDAVEPRKVIAGLPRENIRGYLRGFFKEDRRIFESWEEATYVDWIHDPEKTLKSCIREGLCTVTEIPEGFRLEYTDKGLRLLTSAGNKLLRSTAVKSILTIIEKAKIYNANPKALEGVRKIILFGSALTAPLEIPRVGDVDLIIDKVRKPTTTQKIWEERMKQKEKEYWDSGRSRHDWIDGVRAASRYEWSLFLKRRPSRVSIKTFLEIPLEEVPHIVIFKSENYWEVDAVAPGKT